MRSGDENHHKRGRVAIIFWEGHLGVAPSLINAARSLAGHGYAVDIFTRWNRLPYAKPPAFSGAVAVHECATFEALAAGSRRWRRWSRRFARKRPGLWAVLNHMHFFFFTLRHTARLGYDCFIGVDMMGLPVAQGLGFLRRVPVCYWSLEIRFLSDFKAPLLRLLKRLERVCHRRAPLAVIQDRWRGESLAAENKAGGVKTLYVPNGPLGPPFRDRSEFFHQRLCFSPDSFVALHMGMICPNTLSLELARAAADWPSEIVLIFHERERRRADDPYLLEIENASRGRALLSLEPVGYDDLDRLTASAHVGILLYQEELGPNFSLIAGASGKMGQYLRCGLPVVAPAFRGLEDLIRDYRCGVCVSGPDEVGDALETIRREYAVYRANAFKCYEEVYEFGRHFDGVVQEIEKLSVRKGDEI